MGSQQEAEPSSISVNIDLRPYSFAVVRVRAWTANHGRTIKAFATARCSMVQGSGAGLGRGRAQLQAGRWDFGEETSSMTTVNRPSVVMTETTTIQRSTNMSYSRMYCA
jgi:hypothetical protein